MVSFRFLMRLVKAAFRGSWFQAPRHTEDSWQTVCENIRDHRAILIDVREPSEWSDTQVPGSVLIPLSEILDDPSSAAIHSKISHGKILYLFCRAGGRCRMAAYQLRGHGYDLRPLKAGPNAINEALKQSGENGSDGLDSKRD